VLRPTATARAATLLYRLNGWSIPLAALCRAAGRDVFYARADGLVRKPWVHGALADAGIRFFDFMDYDRVDPRHKMDLKADFAVRALAAIPDEVVADLVTVFREDCRAPGAVTARKLRVCLYHELQTQVAPIADAEAIAALLRRDYKSVDAYLPAASNASFALLRDQLSFRRGPLWVLPSITHGIGSFSRTAVALIRRLIARRRGTPTGAAAGTADGARAERPRVLYFPHHGILYSQLFRRDFLYEQASDSPLHPSRIMHVEITTPLPRQVVDEYQQAGLKWRLLLPAGMLRQSCPTFAAHVLRSGNWRRLPLRTATLVLPTGFTIYRRYRAYLAAINFEPGAVAVIGYEMLFPRALALALQASDIRTVAIHERMQTAFFKDFNLILDRLLVAGPVVAKQIAQNPLCSITHIDCIGLVRSNLFSQRDTRKRERPFVLVLDYESPRDWWGDTDPLVNRATNKAFYLEIIRLALDRPGIDFFIRGKTADWLDNPFFADIAAMIRLMPNLDVDRTYSELNRSYRLATEADCVVAKHTSLGDECLSVGKPVIYHDWSSNSSGYVESFYDYSRLPVLARDYENLVSMLDRALATPREPAGFSGIDVVFTLPTPGYSVAEHARAIIKEYLAPAPAAACTAQAAAVGAL
jgi:hypothetical protein